jgi:hypothetical protein
MPHSYTLIREALNRKSPRKVMVMKTVRRLLSNESYAKIAKEYIAHRYTSKFLRFKTKTRFDSGKKA